MASSSRQKSGSSGSRGQGRKSGVRVIRTGAQSKGAPSSARAGARGAPRGKTTAKKAPAQTRKAQGAPSADLGGYESRTIGSLRQERERQERAQRRQERMVQEKRKSNLPFIIVGVVLFLAASFLAMYLILVNTNVFEIEEIEFTGTDHLTTQEVSALVSIPQGTTLLNVDVQSIESSLKRDAWIKGVDVQRVFPNKLVIHVEERGIAAVVEVPMGVNQTIQNWAISDDGIWLMAIPSRDSEIGSQLSEQIYADAEAALHIEGVPYGVSPQIGAHCTDESVNNALEIISDMTTELKDRIKTVTATDAESTLLTLDNNIEIAFGDTSNIREKERICLQIMEENPTVVYINVRVPDRPTWRSA